MLDNKLTPLITVVTVSYNAASAIERTIQSVIAQTYPYIEYLVIDGGSTDGTVDIIQQYQSYISEWVSESDAGIYDAMNKGIRMATGSWICFMNSGDVFYNNDTVQSVFSQIRESDIIYGDVQLLFEWGTIIRKADAINNIVNGMVFCHQSTFCRVSLLKVESFDIRFKIAADYNFFLQMWKNGKIFEYVNIPVSVFDAENGVSSRKTVEALKDKMKVQERYGTIQSYFELYKCLALSILISFVKILCPHRLVQKIRKLHLLLINRKC